MEKRAYLDSNVDGWTVNQPDGVFQVCAGYFELFEVNCQTLSYTRDVPKANAEGKSMFHLIWYILIGLISGVIAKSVMHVHIAIFWTIVLGIVGSIIGGGVSHMFSRPTNERYHPAGLILSTLGAIVVLAICYKLKIHFPQV
jgi:uncharacterized membrane protein YeaQ/YmgE (transglycosylase-associated protein family)